MDIKKTGVIVLAAFAAVALIVIIAVVENNSSFRKQEGINVPKDELYANQGEPQTKYLGYYADVNDVDFSGARFVDPAIQSPDRFIAEAICSDESHEFFVKATKDLKGFHEASYATMYYMIEGHVVGFTTNTDIIPVPNKNGSLDYVPIRGSVYMNGSKESNILHFDLLGSSTQPMINPQDDYAWNTSEYLYPSTYVYNADGYTITLLQNRDLTGAEPLFITYLDDQGVQCHYGRSIVHKSGFTKEEIISSSAAFARKMPDSLYPAIEYSCETASGTYDFLIFMKDGVPTAELDSPELRKMLGYN